MTAEEHRREHSRLRELTHRNLMRLIDSELSLALTMSELAETEAEMGEESHAKELLGKVKEAIETVCLHTSGSHISEEEQREIEDRVQELTKRLNAARQEVFGEA
jgi:hypothetical protein